MSDHAAELLSSLKTDVTWIKDKLTSMDAKIEGNAKEARVSFAQKWVEVALKSVIGMIVMAVVAALLGLVLLKPAIAAFFY